MMKSSTGPPNAAWMAQGSIAKHPYPGYFGNSAGPTAYFLAYGSGARTLLTTRGPASHSSPLTPHVLSHLEDDLQACLKFGCQA